MTKKETLMFLAYINMQQEFDGVPDYIRFSWSKVLQKIAASSLFIDNVFTRDVNLKIVNHFDEDIILYPVSISKDKNTKTAKDFYRLMSDALVGLGGAADDGLGSDWRICFSMCRWMRSRFTETICVNETCRFPRT